MADAAPAAPAPASASGGFLSDATVGSSKGAGGFLSGATVGKSAAPTQTPGTGAFSNISVNNPASDLASTAGGPQLDTTKPLASPSLSSVQPAETSSIGSKFLSANPDLKIDTSAQTSTPAVGPNGGTPFDDSAIGIGVDTLKGIPDAAAQVSGAINNAVIQKPADLLANTPYMKEVGAGMNADPSDFGSTFATTMLQKLSLGLNTVTGLTGGLYEAPQTDPDNGLLDKGIKAITQGLGMAVGVGAIGKVAAAVPAVGAVTESLTNLVSRFPLVGKYLAPYIAPLVENASGFSVYSQLNPQLGADLSARAKTFAVSIGEAPLYTALGALNNAGVSLPASFTLGFAMAKLSGASNQDAATAGAAFAFLDAAGRAGGERGNTPEEQQKINDQKIADEAYATITKYSGIKVSADSSDNELKTAYRKAIHVAHPDAGGTQESGAAVNNAYNVLTKGRVSSPTPEEQSISTLRGELKEGVATHGPDATKVAAMENLKIDFPTADRLVRAAQTPNTPDEISQASKVAVAKLHPELNGAEGVPVAGVDAKQFGKLGPEAAAPLAKIAATRYQKEVIEPQREAGGPTIIGADDMKDHFAKDYNDNNHPVYSQAAQILVDRALKENTDGQFAMTGGGPASAKTELLVNHLKESGYKGIIYDSNLSNYEGAVKTIESARAAGKKIRIYGVIPNLEKARGFTITRENETGRGISDKTFANGHVGFPETLQKLLENGVVSPDEVRLLDTRDIKGLDTAKATVKSGGFVKDPLAVVSNLGYTREDIATKYAKENYTKEGGYIGGSRQELRDASVRKEAGEASAEDRTDTAGLEKREDGNKNLVEEKSRFATAQEMLLAIGSPKTGNQGLTLNRTELNQLVKYLVTLKDPELIKERGIVYTPYATSKENKYDVILGETGFEHSRLEGGKIVAEINSNGKLTGRVRIHATPLRESEIVDRLNGSGLMALAEGSGESPNKEEKNTQNPKKKVTPPINTQKGAIAPGQIAADVAKSVSDLKAMIDHHQHVDDVVGQISNSIFKEEGANKVLKVQLTQLVNEARTKSTAAERQNVYHYMEDGSTELTENERQNVLPIVEAMDRELTGLRTQARAAGIYITGDILEEMTPRNAIEKGGVIDKAIDAYREGKRIISNGGKLTTSVGSGSKHRVYHILVDEDGKRTVVAVKDGKVTAIEKGKAKELGSTSRVITPKVKEFFDESVMTKLNNLAKELGVTHQRVATGRSEGLPPSRAGVSYGGADLIKTRLGPTSVLAHELGHQIDYKYGMKAVMKAENFDKERQRQVKDEMRALADQRFEGREVSDNFKKYVRKDSEKMAVMFEAYVANRQMFQEVAPHLYDDFRDFLAAHEELRPFLDVKPSISLGSEQHGGEHVAGISGREFVDDNGKSYIVGQATTKEIEANTGTRYYKDPLANYALAIERTARAVRANELLKKIKESPDFKDTIKNVDGSDGDIPTTFKSTRLDQFRNYRMEPHLAEAFDDLAKRSEGGRYIAVYDEINNLLITAMVINPIMHYPNVAVGWGAATAAAGVVPETDFISTLKQVLTKDPEYLKWVGAGAPFQYLRQTNAEFADSMLTDALKDVNIQPTRYEEIAKALGYANPVEWAKGLEKISADSTWVANDVMLFNALKTYQKANDSTMEKAITEVGKRLADYRVPPRVLGSRALSLAMQNNAVFVFTRFHYSGVIKPWIASLADTVDPRSEENGGPSGKQRLAGARTLAYFALMYFIYQLADKGLEKLTGNDNTYMSMAGPMRIVQNVQKSIQSGSPVPLFSSTFSFTPAINIIGSIITGYDFSNFFKPIYGPGGEGVPTALGNQAAIYQGVEGAFNGNASWTNFALNMGGVYSPKSNVEMSNLNAMLNVEKPQVQAQMKADIAAGNTEAATVAAKDFNDRLEATISASLKASGKSGDAAQVQYYLLTFPNGLGAKGYAVRMPSATTMKNYNAKAGETANEKLFGKQATSTKI